MKRVRGAVSYRWVYGHGLVPTAIHVADVGDRVSEWCVARAYCGAYVSVIDEDWQAGDVCAECLSLARAVELRSAAHTGAEPAPAWAAFPVGTDAATR